MRIDRVKQMKKALGVAEACRQVGIPRRTYYRSVRCTVAERKKRQPKRHARRLSAELRAEIRTVMNSERFRDLPPRQIYATLLDEGTDLYHWRTMYDILYEYDEVRERRNQWVHPPYRKPQLLATGPNQVWSWDIMRLRGAQKWTRYRLFVMLDVFSRYVVGWMVAPGESAVLAYAFITTTCEH